MVRLVDDLLDVSRIARGKVELRKEIVEVAPLVDRAVDSISWAFKSKDQSLEVSVPTEPISIDADPVRIVQVLGNLLNNASKYTPEGGHVELTVRRDGEIISLGVKDNGIGIERELLPCVFDLFTQSSRAFDRAQGGMGIGLTLVRSLVELHRGSVSAESRGVGQGSRFTILLPVCGKRPAGDASLARRPQSESPHHGGGRQLWRGPACLHPAQKSWVIIKSKWLTMARSALEKMKSFEPEIVLLDIGLPGMNGYEVARQMRALAG